VQSHGTQTALCPYEVMRETLPVSYFHLRLFVLEEVGEGQMFLCGYLSRVVNPFWEVGGSRLFAAKFLKYPDPTFLNWGEGGGGSFPNKRQLRNEHDKGLI